MKYRFLFGLALAGLLVTTPAMAGPVITFNEDGAAFVGLGTPNPMRVTTFQSMDPVSGMTTLTLDITGAVGLIPKTGDVVVTESVGAAPIISDLLRFGNQGLLYVFSDIEAGEPRAAADVGLPTPQLVPVVKPEIGTEDTVNGLIYTPNDAEPGFIPGATAKYEFISDTPEPASIALAGIGALGMIGYRLRRRNPASA